MKAVFAHSSWLYWSLASFFSGALTTLAFAPFDLSWLVFVTLAIAFYFWNTLPVKQAAISGWLFSLGLQCTGVSWIYHSLYTHGSAPAIFAALLIFLLCCYLSLYVALAAFTANRFLSDNPVLRLMIFYPAAWLVFEWLQGYVMTGFAWMQLGYTQIDLPFSGFAPVLGSHAVSGFVAVCAGTLVLILQQLKQKNFKAGLLFAIPAALLFFTGSLLKMVEWTEKQGEPVNVSVVQGNIAQKDKWKMHLKQPTLDRYRDLSLAQKEVDLFVWPETAVPDYWYRVVPYINQLRNDMKQREADLLLGIFVKNDDKQLLNSVISVNGGVYNKRHLVPLGEFIPLRFLIDFFNRFVKIPMSDIASGDDDQALLTVAGIPLGVSICFEEAFSRDVMRDLPEAKILVNVSNDAWFENSHQPHQHHVIARMRALEAGRYMIRSTNTGITSFIAPDGKVVKQLPQFEVGVLNGAIQPMVGATPFVRWGDALMVGLCALLLLGFAYRKKAQG